jgi:hypothetical protein
MNVRRLRSFKAIEEKAKPESRNTVGIGQPRRGAYDLAQRASMPRCQAVGIAGAEASSRFPPAYSPLMPAALMIGHHFSILALPHP